MNDEVRRAYLARLGVEAEPPSVDALFRLHRAHVERVPYETVWIHLGQGWDIDPRLSAGRIANEGRGGYCYHLNGALALLLDSLGYRVQRHLGGVHGPDGPDEAAIENHLVLTVTGLPTDANPGGVWYLDTGLGDGLHEPLPLQAGPHRQGPFEYLLDETPGGVGDWHLTHDPSGGFSGMAWRSPTVAIDAFAARHIDLSTSPESGFVKVMTVQRRDAAGADVLRGLSLKRIGEGECACRVESQGDLVDVLGDVFGLDIMRVAGGRLPVLWERLEAADAAWRAAQTA